MEKDNRVLLNRARFILEEGQPERAREVLKSICPENEEQKTEFEYLLAWSYVLEASWDEAEERLTSLVDFIETHSEQQAGEENSNEQHRWRHALSLFNLGKVAVNIGRYEDASHHFTKALKLLKDRRVQLSKARIIRFRTRYYLAMTCIERGLFAAAKQNYEEALQSYEEIQKDSVEDLREDLAGIYYGLCDLYRKTGRLIDAQEMGYKALELYDDLGAMPMKSRIHNLLGHIYMQLGDFKEAAYHFTDGLVIATTSHSQRLIMVNCAALAKLRMAEDRLKDAMEYCKVALEHMKSFNDDHLSGMAYLTAAKVAQAEASKLQGEQMREHMANALGYYEQACNLLDKTQAYDKIAEAQGGRAQILEALGRTREAIACWNSAYKAQADSLGPPLF